MTEDARFEDSAERPLRLVAHDAEDLAVISTFAQDAVGKVGRIHWMPRRRRFSMLLYRFRWEDARRAGRELRAYERVAAALTVDDVLGLKSRGVDRADREAVLNLLSLTFRPTEDGAGFIDLACSGQAGFELAVECVNVSLVDLTRPWAAGGKPDHID